MKNYILLLSFLVAIHSFAKEKQTAPALDYVKNEGQWEENVRYKADLKGGWVFIENNALTYLFMEDFHHHAKQGEKGHSEETHTLKAHAYQLSWLNANKNVKLSDGDRQPYVNNYIIGNDQEKWKSNVGNYRAVYYHELYNKIDVKLYSEAQSLKTDYIVHVGGNPNNIMQSYKGTEGLFLESDGRLRINTSVNTVYELKPFAYQEKNGNRVEVKCNFHLENSTLTYEFPEGYDKSNDLIIDPTLIFSTYSGSFTDNWGSSATNDANGNMFLGGISIGAGYPTTLGAFQVNYGGGSGQEPTDVVITKFTANGTSRLYSTYLGGNSNELLQSLYCTPQNELIVLMATSSTNFPTTTNAYDRSFNGGSSTAAIGNSISFPNGSDIVVLKLNSAGSALVGSTFFGGSGNDGLNADNNLQFNYGDDTRGDIAVDVSGNILITTATASNNLPGTAGHAQPNYAGLRDGFVASLNSNLSVLNWATYIGGTGDDVSYSIQLDSRNNNIFVCGGTTSTQLPATASGLNPTYRGGSADGFITKLSSTGTSFLNTTFIGTPDYDQSYLMDLDKNNDVYVFGQTNGDYPVSGGVYSNAGANQFIHKLNNNLTTTMFSTVFGSPNSSSINISPTAFLVDVCGNIYASGWGGNVNSTGNTVNMPVTSDAYQSFTDGSDFYLIDLNANASSLKYATYFGEFGGIGDHVDGGTSRFDKNGVVYQAVCASCGGTNSFPITSGAYGQNNNSTNCNMAGFKFKFDLTAMQIISISATPASGCVPLSVSFNYTATQPATSFLWTFGDGQSSTAEFPTHIYTTPGTYTCKLIITNPNNCNTQDSATVIVQVNAVKTTSISSTICQGQSTVFNGQTLTTAGTYRDTLTTSLGCDSFIVLTLFVNPVKTTNIARGICQGQSITFNGQVITQSGTYRDTLQQANGCDSFIVLTVTLNPPKTTNITRSICQGQTIVFNGQTLTTAGIYRDTLLQSNGCDSFIVMSLTVSPSIINPITRTICQGNSVVVGQHVYTQTGSYHDTLRSQFGCDSIVILTLIVNPTKQTNLTRMICQGESITIGNHTYTVSGNYRDTLRTSLGCDSVIVLALTVTDRILNNVNAAICIGQSYTVGNHIYTQTGNYTDTFRSASGCDSVVNLSLLVHPRTFSTLTKTLCEGESVVVGGVTYNQAGTYTDTILSSVGCDSIINLTVIVNPNKQTNLARTICEGNAVTVGNQTFTTSGNYTVHLSTSLGCDSTVFLALTVNPNKLTTLTRQICQGEEVVIGNHTYTVSGNYSDTFTTSLSCDSIVRLNLTVNPVKTTNLNIIKCTGTSYTIGSQTYTEGGNYTLHFQTSLGCDSTVFLALSFSDTLQEQVNRIICQGDSTQAGGQYFSVAGDYTIHLTATEGCDSTIHLSLQVNPKKRTDTTFSICQNDTLKIGQNSYTAAGQYEIHYTTSQGCDSLLSFNLLVNPNPAINATVDYDSVIIGQQVQLDVIPEGDFSYNWIPADRVSETTIANPTSSPVQTTTFIVQVTDVNGCISKDSVTVIVIIPDCNSANVYLPNAFTPNGDGKNDTFMVRSEILKSGYLLIFDRWGNKIFESDDIHNGWDGKYKGKLCQDDSYAYYFKGECIQGNTFTLKGNVTLLK